MGLIRHWQEKEKSALTMQLTANDAENRFKGMGQARRNEAVAFVVATVPVLVASILFAPYNEAGAVGKVILNFTLAWAAVLLLVTLAFVILTLVRIRKAN